jgi:Na+-transporting methylmalonyl-CoA/oxaloacetate decarboxylase gamma subunit
MEPRKDALMETIDWNYAISTLLIRFVGIFVVLAILQVIIQITGRIFARLDAKKDSESKKASAPSEALTQEEAAVVGSALYLYEKG